MPVTDFFTATVSLSMTGELHRKLKDRAEADGMTVNDAIRDAIAKYVRRRER